MYDDHDNPDMNITLDLAIEWERQHGTVYKTEKVRQVDVNSTIATSRQSSDTGDSDSEAVHKIDYIPIKKMTSEEGRLLAKQNNEVVSLLKKQAYTVLDEDKRSAGGRSFYRKGSDTSSRSSSNWSRSRRSRSREKQSSWRGRDRRRRSDDRKQDRSKENYKYKHKDKKNGKFDKKRRDRKDGRVAEVREDSPSQSEKSDASSQSDSESDSHSE